MVTHHINISKRKKVIIIIILFMEQPSDAKLKDTPNHTTPS